MGLQDGRSVSRLRHSRSADVTMRCYSCRRGRVSGIAVAGKATFGRGRRPAGDHAGWQPAATPRLTPPRAHLAACFLRTGGYARAETRGTRGTNVCRHRWHLLPYNIVNVHYTHAPPLPKEQPPAFAALPPGGTPSRTAALRHRSADAMQGAGGARRHITFSAASSRVRHAGTDICRLAFAFSPSVAAHGGGGSHRPPIFSDILLRMA